MTEGGREAEEERMKRRRAPSRAAALRAARVRMA